MKVSPDKKWLAYIKIFTEKQGVPEKKSFKLVIKDLKKFNEKNDDSEDTN